MVADQGYVVFGATCTARIFMNGVMAPRFHAAAPTATTTTQHWPVTRCSSSTVTWVGELTVITCYHQIKQDFCHHKYCHRCHEPSEITWCWGCMDGSEPQRSPWKMKRDLQPLVLTGVDFLSVSASSLDVGSIVGNSDTCLSCPNHDRQELCLTWLLDDRVGSVLKTAVGCRRRRLSSWDFHRCWAQLTSVPAGNEVTHLPAFGMQKVWRDGTK